MKNIALIVLFPLAREEVTRFLRSSRQEEPLKLKLGASGTTEGLLLLLPPVKLARRDAPKALELASCWMPEVSKKA